MARSIETIQQAIVTDLNPAGRGLSTSKYAEWRLFSRVVATAINLFEVILDLFRTEVERKAYMSTAGTTAWFAEICRQFQSGHTLVYDPKTAGYGYATDDPAARIIKMVAINERERTLYIKVAKQDAEGRMVPLSDAERQDFTSYMRKRTIAGTSVVIITTPADIIRYNLEVYYDPGYPVQTVRDNVIAALVDFKLSLSFDARVYSQRLIDKVMSADGVVTVDPVAIEHKTSEPDAVFAPVGVFTELASGHFEYDENDNVLTLTPAIG